MALFSVIKCDAVRDIYVWKFPTEDLTLGSQLIVRPGQTAFFCKGGKIYDEFKEGTYTIISENLPLLNKIINIPFGGKSPFQAEVWFINTLTVLDARWGTPNPILLEDPGYGIVIPIRAYGQYGIKIGNPSLFFEQFIGTLRTFSKYDIEMFFTGIIVTRVSDYISEQLVLQKIPILKIQAFLQDISETVTKHLSGQFDKYGIDLVNFYIISLNMPEDDPNVMKLKEVTGKRMNIETLGKDIYKFDGIIDVMKNAAENPSSGGLIGGGLGVGAGISLGTSLGQQLNHLSRQMSSDTSTQNQAVPPQPPTASEKYYIYQDNQQYGPYSLDTLKVYLKQMLINRESLMWKAGLADWEPAGSIPEMVALFDNDIVTPPPPPVKPIPKK